ncbi:UvrD-helicase domain-containing protein [Lactobacillus sp. R2/2]|nr:UvrD-helicase domain-containing protein [Lactobacillus sp. R2/2]
MTAVVKAELALIDRFNELKRAENLLDFSDMEQLAYQILSQDTSASQMARTFYQNKFSEILVDEYQDINPLQENILQLIKKDGQNNLFMVGDVKQSIYGFRQAEPSLFLHKYQEAALKENQAKEERILLSDNFPLN